MSEDTVVLSADDFKQSFVKTKDIVKEPRPEQRPVEMYDLDGVYVRTFKSPSEAAREAGIGIKVDLITRCCSGITLRCMKQECIYLYKGNSIEDRMAAIDKKNLPRRVYEYSLEGKLLNRYANAKDAARITGIKSHNIQSCVSRNPNHLTCYNRIFLHPDESIQDRLEQIEKRNELNKVWSPVKEYTIDGKFVRDWPNHASAERYLGLARGRISSCLAGKSLSVQNRIFLYPEDSIEERLEKVRHRRAQPSMTRERKIAEYSLNGRVIRKWDSMSEAERHYGIPQGSICHCCKGNRMSINGRIFLYEGDNIHKRLKKINSKSKTGEIC